MFSFFLAQRVGGGLWEGCKKRESSPRIELFLFLTNLETEVGTEGLGCGGRGEGRSLCSCNDSRPWSWFLQSNVSLQSVKTYVFCGVSRWPPYKDNPGGGQGQSRKFIVWGVWILPRIKSRTLRIGVGWWSGQEQSSIVEWGSVLVTKLQPMAWTFVCCEGCDGVLTSISISDSVSLALAL